MAHETRELDTAIAALPAFGLEGGTVTFLQDLVNATFRVRHDGTDWHLKVYRDGRHDPAVIRSELVFLEALAGDGFPAPRPRRTRDGDLLHADTVAVCSWLPGRPLQADRTPAQFRAVGELLGKLHAFAAGWTPPAGFTRPRLDAAGIYGDPDGEGDRDRAWQRLDDAVRTDLERARGILEEREALLGDSPQVFGLVHADPSFGNVLFDGDTPALIDFDDLSWAHQAFDLAVVLAGAWGKPDNEEHWEALIDGYRQVRELPEAAVTSLPALMAARAASLILWAAAQAPDHPWIPGQHERLRAYLQAL